MRVAVTGASGFVGRYIVAHLVGEGHQCRCWTRPGSNRQGIEADEWVEGELGDAEATQGLVAGCDAVVHAGLYHVSKGFARSEGDILPFVEKNVVGSLQLIEAAYAAGIPRFVYISTCAVHEVILDDRPLDEAHPLWSKSHYGAHKAAVEQFVHSYGLGYGYNICALRPCGVYGIAEPADQSKWFPLVRSVVRGEPVECGGGGKEVHAADVARAVGLLLRADNTTGQAYSCCDRYVSQREVAELAKQFSDSTSVLNGDKPEPKHKIVTEKIRGLGLTFGGTSRLEQTVEELVRLAR